MVYATDAAVGAVLQQYVSDQGRSAFFIFEVPATRGALLLHICAWILSFLQSRKTVFFYFLEICLFTNCADCKTLIYTFVSKETAESVLQFRIHARLSALFMVVITPLWTLWLDQIVMSTMSHVMSLIFRQSMRLNGSITTGSASAT